MATLKGPDRLGEAERAGALTADHKLTPEIRAQAKANISHRVENNTLPRIEDWDGDLLEGWLDLLGLNGRPVSTSSGSRLRHLMH